jgi:hypothetical protein
MSKQNMYTTFLHRWEVFLASVQGKLATLEEQKEEIDQLGYR